MDIIETMQEEVRLMETRRPMEKYVADSDNNDILRKIEPRSNEVKKKFKILNSELWENNDDLKKYIRELKEKYPEVYQAMVDYKGKLSENYTN